MKEKIYALIILAMMFQSCSHIAIFKECEYLNDDSPYPATAMKFAYYANGHSLSSSLKELGERIHLKATTDTLYPTFLQSAVDVEEQLNNDTLLHSIYEAIVFDGKKNLQSLKFLDKHGIVIDEITKQLNILCQYNDVDFKNYWKKVYQLSHRGIIQHYMKSDAAYNALSEKNKALVYGYILSKDISECEKLSETITKKEKETMSSLQHEMKDEIASRESKLEEIKAEEERRRKQQEAEERARERERRWHDDSWIGGHWRYVSQNGATNVYIDTKSQTLKEYYTEPFSMRPELVYSGEYNVKDNTYNGCKVISYKGTYILADPNTGKLYADKKLQLPFTRAE